MIKHLLSVSLLIKILLDCLLHLILNCDIIETHNSAFAEFNTANIDF